MNLLTAQVIKNRISTASPQAMQEVLISMIGHAHLDGNIEPIAQNAKKLATLKSGRKMLAFLKDNAPITYKAKTKKFSYVIDKANREIDLETLPYWDIKVKPAPQWKASKFEAKLDRVELATMSDLSSEIETVEAYLKALEAEALERITEVEKAA